MDLGLEGKVALVTGGSRGIGREVALALAREGARLAVNYQANDAAASAVEADIRALGQEVLLVKASVADPDEVATMVQRVGETLGPIAVLVNNAGILRDRVLINMTFEEWNDVIRTNLDGVFNVTRPVAFSMMRKRRGRIVNVASLSAVAGSAGQANYTAAKAGVIGFTRSLSKELGPFGITVNAVAPGYIGTEMLNGMPQEKLDAARPLIPAGRFGSPEEVADMVVFLASERAAYISGQVIGIDGGLW